MSTAAAPQPENEVKLTLWDHLRELRKRVLLAAYGLVVGMVAVGAWVQQLVDLLMAPVLAALKPAVVSEAGRAALQAAAQAQGIEPISQAALLECATTPAVSPVAKAVLATLAAAKDVGQPLAAALRECAAMPATPGAGTTLVYTSAIEPMMVYIKVAMYGALFVAAPWILFQLWQFIAPGLYKRERRVVVPFLFFGTLLFYAGAAFCFVMVMPAAFPAMLQVASAGTMTPMLSISEQLGLVMAMLLGFGVVFEVPVVIAFLSMIGVVTADGLARYRRYAVLVNVIAASIITPTGDPLNLAMMAVPMIVFYEVGILLARILGKKKPADQAIAAS
ncbi:MAG: twin-arginine translocase subunit TatC [Anaeromyxobacteraceae bacterium]|nr:twin-arginine translocase subunit TatC [Anaeromyxobacteraceae bacterium]